MFIFFSIVVDHLSYIIILLNLPCKDSHFDKMSDLTSEQVLSNLKKGELQCREKKGGSSDVWTNFNEIVDMQDQFIDYVMCKNCEHILKYNYKIGTSTLKRHKCSFDEKQPKITSYWTTKNFPTAAKDVTTEKIVNFVCKDLRPFEIITGQGFREFAQEMINIGSKYGYLQVDELFPHPTTISRNIIKSADFLKKKIALNLKDIFEIVGGAFTSDMWTDDYRKISYISLTVHYIDDTWKMKEQILAASKFPDVRHTADNIKKVILNILKGYNLVPDSSMKRYTFVTDSASNYISAFKGLNHIPCFAHR